MARVKFEPNFDFGESKKRNRRNRRGGSKNIRRIVRQEINSIAEKKYHASTSIGAGISTTVDLYSLSDVDVGINDNERIGDQITVTSMEFRGYLEVGDTNNIVRVILFQWFPDTVPTAVDILISSVNGLISPYSHDHRYEFNILFDRTYMMSNDWQHYSKFHVYIKKFRERKIQYVGGTYVGNNKIYLAVVSDSAAVPNPTMAYIAKLNFKDL